MKRVPVSPWSKFVSRIWPVFSWRFCKVCQKEFRREWGWLLYKPMGSEPYPLMVREICTACRSCCPTIDDFAKTFDRVGDLVPPKGRSGVIMGKNRGF